MLKVQCHRNLSRCLSEAFRLKMAHNKYSFTKPSQKKNASNQPLTCFSADDAAVPAESSPCDFPLVPGAPGESPPPRRARRETKPVDEPPLPPLPPLPLLPAIDFATGGNKNLMPSQSCCSAVCGVGGADHDVELLQPLTPLSHRLKEPPIGCRASPTSEFVDDLSVTRLTVEERGRWVWRLTAIRRFTGANSFSSKLRGLLHPAVEATAAPLPPALVATVSKRNIFETEAGLPEALPLLLLLLRLAVLPFSESLLFESFCCCCF